jgi:hypothetical protein
MKKDTLYFLKNMVMYAVIIIGIYFLYHYNNQDAGNIPHSDFSFVYAKF